VARGFHAGKGGNGDRVRFSLETMVSSPAPPPLIQFLFVSQASALPAASFRFHLAMVPLGVRLTTPG
jgi:hypothetical protein